MDTIFFYTSYIIGIILIIVGLILITKPKFVSDAIISDKIVIPTSVLLIALGLAAVAYPTSQYIKQTPSPTTTAAPTVTPTPAATPAPIAVTSPADGAGVKGAFTVSGTAPDLGKDKLWLFVWSENATVKGKVYYRTSDTPIDVAGGIWSTDVGQLGAPGEDIGHPFTLVLVRATPSCSSAIAHIAPNPAKEVFVRELPNGCSVVPPPLVVNKDA
jgi:hypothetical protein